MRLDKVDLNLFIVLDAIYRERSVTKVAQQLNLTQPAVSNSLSRLRQTFDDQMFVRTPDGMIPTPVTDSIIGDVRKALGLLGQSVGTGARFDPATSEKTFHLGMNDLAQALLLPRLREHIASIAPHIVISSYYVDRHQAAEELKSGALDLLLDSPAVNAREFGQLSLTKLDYVVAMQAQHPLGQKQLSLKDYLQAEHIHVSSRRRGSGQMDIALHALGHRRRVKMRVQNYLVADRIVQQTDLLWTVPKVIVKNTRLQTVEVPFKVEPLVWNLYWYKSAEDDPANLWIRNCIRKIMSSIV